MAYVVIRTPVCDRGGCVDKRTGEYLPVQGYRLGRSTGTRGGRPREFLLCEEHGKALEELLALGGSGVKSGAASAAVVPMEEVEARRKPARKRAAKKA